MSIIRDWAERAEAFVRGRPKRALVGLAVLGLVVLAVQHYAGEWFWKNVGNPVASRFLRIAAEPMGFGGLLFFFFLVLCVLVMFLDTSPNGVVFKQWLDKKSGGKEKPLVLSWEEKQLVQDLRTLWQLHGQYAVGTLYGMYETIVSRAKRKLYWAPLLESSKERFRQAIGEVEGALAHSSTLGIVEVRERFNRMLNAYFEVIRWIAQTEGHGDTDLKEEHLAKLRRSWSEYHYSFRQELNKLETIPGHRRTLTASLDFCEDRYLVDFVSEAETRSQPMLSERSTSNTEVPPSGESSS